MFRNKESIFYIWQKSYVLEYKIRKSTIEAFKYVLVVFLYDIKGKFLSSSLSEASESAYRKYEEWKCQ